MLSILQPLLLVLLFLLPKATFAGCERESDNLSLSDALSGDFKGTYINTEYPVTCAGNITGWLYCYHNDTIDQNSTYTMVAAVWTYHSSLEKFVIHPEGFTYITLINGRSESCMTIRLEPSVFITVAENDLIGVILSYNPIPVLSFNATSTATLRKVNRTSTAANFCLSESTVPANIVLHIHPIIETTGNSTIVTSFENSSLSTEDLSDCDTTTFASTESTSTRGKNDSFSKTDSSDNINITVLEEDGILSKIEIAFVILCILLVLVAFSMTLFTGFYCIEKAKQKRLRNTLSNRNNATATERNENQTEDTYARISSVIPYQVALETRYQEERGSLFTMQQNTAYRDPVQLEIQSHNASNEHVILFFNSRPTIPARNMLRNNEDGVEIRISAEDQYDYARIN